MGKMLERCFCWVIKDKSLVLSVVISYLSKKVVSSTLELETSRSINSGFSKGVEFH